MATAEGSQTASNGSTTEKIQPPLLYSHVYSFFGQKVSLALYEKKIQFNLQLVNIANGEQYQSWFLKLNSRGEVPVLKDGETVIVDSARIMNYLEDKYGSDETPHLIPSGENQEINGKHTHFTTVLRDLPIAVLTMGAFYHTEFSRGFKLPFIFPVRRHMKAMTDKKSAKLKLVAEKNAEVSEVLLEKAEKSDRLKETIVDKAGYEMLLKKIDELLSEVEIQLASHEDADNWLIYKDFTIADIELTVLLERLSVLGFEDRFWGPNANKPNIAKYYVRVKQRESYKKTMPTLLFHIKTLMQQSLTYISF